MAKGTITGTGSSAQAIAASEYREYIFIQKTNATTLAIGIGEAAEAGKGVQLTNVNDTVLLRGPAARRAINVIGNGGTAAYQTGYDVAYTPGPTP